MLGRTHAAFGAAAYGAALIAADALGVHLPGPQLGAGVVIAAGSALAPDLDDSGSTPGRALPLSHLPIFGGHRTRTHTLAAVLAVGLAAAICAQWTDSTAVLAALMATMGATWASGFVRRHGMVAALGAGVLVGVVVAKVVGPGVWLVLAVPLLVHLHRVLVRLLVTPRQAVRQRIVLHDGLDALYRPPAHLVPAFLRPVGLAPAVGAVEDEFTERIAGGVGEAPLHRTVPVGIDEIVGQVVAEPRTSRHGHLHG